MNAGSNDSQMLVETGRVVSVEHDALWVETLQKSTCSSCGAKEACGQKSLSVLAPRAHYIRVLLDADNSRIFRQGDLVQLAIPANAVVKGALLVYLLPLLAMVLAALLAEWQSWPEPVVIAFGLAGLFAGGALIALHNRVQRNNPDYQPRIVNHSGAVCLEISE